MSLSLLAVSVWKTAGTIVGAIVIIGGAIVTIRSIMSNAGEFMYRNTDKPDVIEAIYIGDKSDFH